MENTTEIVINTKYHNKISVILEGLDPRYCHIYEFIKAANLGVNCGYCAIQQHGTATVVKTARRAQETGEPAWLIAPIFRRCNQTLEQYMTLLGKKITPLKDTYQIWDNFVGVYFELPMGVDDFTGEDLLDMTRVFSETYGKRIMVNFTPEQIINPAFTKEEAAYITDAYVKCNKYEFGKELSEEIDGKTFEKAEDIYSYYTEKMKALMPDVRVWYNPLADVNIGEEKSILSLEGFKKLLLKEEKAGGLYVDGYKSYIDRDKLDWLLDAENPERWNKYIDAAKKVCGELRAIDIK